MVQLAIRDTPPFLGDLSVLDLKTEYRSLKEDPVKNFYRPCLAERDSTTSGRSAYFRSTVFERDWHVNS